MARDLPHVTRRCDEFLQSLFLEPQDRPRLLDGGDRDGEANGVLQIRRRPVDPFLVATAIDLVHELLSSGSGESGNKRHG